MLLRSVYPLPSQTGRSCTGVPAASYHDGRSPNTYVCKLHADNLTWGYCVQSHCIQMFESNRAPYRP